MSLNSLAFIRLRFFSFFDGECTIIFFFDKKWSLLKEAHRKDIFGKFWCQEGWTSSIKIVLQMSRNPASNPKKKQMGLFLLLNLKNMQTGKCIFLLMTISLLQYRSMLKRVETLFFGCLPEKMGGVFLRTYQWNQRVHILSK